jgi:sugar lactone lactonase YvrE
VSSHPFGSRPVIRNSLYLCFFAAIALSAGAFAHPGVGIVEDSRGNVYYTDLNQIWKVAPDGSKSIAVAGVHSHELYLDREDNLFGEHLWYEGEDTDRWAHYVWRLSPDGNLTQVIPETEGFLPGYSFVRDGSGTMYWAERDEKVVLKKRTAGGEIVAHSEGEFHDPSWITATVGGVLYLMDGGDLIRVSSDGEVAKLAVKLSSKTPPPADVAERFYHMGLWTDSEENIYVAIYREQAVVRVSPDGDISIVTRSAEPWSPTGGICARDGALWILEESIDQGSPVSRVRRIGKNGTERAF